MASSDELLINGAWNQVRLSLCLLAASMETFHNARRHISIQFKSIFVPSEESIRKSAICPFSSSSHQLGNGNLAVSPLCCVLYLLSSHCMQLLAIFLSADEQAQQVHFWLLTCLQNCSCSITPIPRDILMRLLPLYAVLMQRGNFYRVM